MSHRLIAALVFVATGAAQSPLVIVLEGDPPEFRVKGSAILQRLNNPNSERIFQVAVDKPGVPPLAGRYFFTDGVLSFRPQFPLEPGLSYRAQFRLISENAAATFAIPKPVIESTTVVEQIYPTASIVPENQLKLYIHFSAPMSRGRASKYLHLIDGMGKEVQLPFLELDEELWDREYRRLTVLFDPGRIKRDLVPNREIGPPLKQGGLYTLVVDAAWPDAKNVPLKQGREKKFSAGPPDRTPLDTATWNLTAPLPDTSEPLFVDFPEPIDAALLLHFIDVIAANGEAVPGRVILDREEKRWIFTPAKPWIAGSYSLDIVGTLEDLAGNKIGKAFDVDSFDRVDQRITTTSYKLPFNVGPVSRPAPLPPKR